MCDPGGRSLGCKAVPTRQFVQTDSETRLASAMAWGTSVIAVRAVVGTLNTMLMSVLERTRELGLLRAVGWSRARVVRLILGESLLIGSSARRGGPGRRLLVRALAAWSFTRNCVHPNLSPSAVGLGGDHAGGRPGRIVLPAYGAQPHHLRPCISNKECGENPQFIETALTTAKIEEGTEATETVIPVGAAVARLVGLSQVR